jgi:hypothetical protein
MVWGPVSPLDARLDTPDVALGDPVHPDPLGVLIVIELHVDADAARVGLAQDRQGHVSLASPGAEPAR